MSLLPIDITSYNSFRTDALTRASQGLGYNVDNWLGYQCWDLAAELWMHIAEFEDGELWPKTGTNLYVSECWTQNRVANSGSSFTLIFNLSDVKRGDVVVIDSSAISETGHIAFADENYNGTTNMYLLGQNQVDPDPNVGHIPTVTKLDVSAFLGAFRYKAWNSTPPEPPVTVRRSHFPWVLYTRKLRGLN